MTVEQFNEKYNHYLERGHYGLDISIPSVIAYLDRTFETLVSIPGFKFTQIKLKFNSARFYCDPDTIDTNVIEEEIDRLVAIYDKERRRSNESD